ncbi:DUF4326 domain-containing protein [Sphingomonas ginsenosidimutans]|jgi:hypothetical protein|uniref:DUF4326 domain-containing protein n=1 Tax=Sphingomonas ginsenosidimutans TaxID=862134 RepID=UPI001D379EC3|nr:DUF4326 domain-containing protein [Sphingomonas ginsenosidimutans]MBY0301277.1 DUF4326 domain-containing protein [Sphingomonas ginsenosidimutans]
MPQRIHRTRRRANFTPPGAVYVGRPTIFSNPFDGRPRIGHKRSVILHAAWLDGQLNAHVLVCAGLSEAEIRALHRRRDRVLDLLPGIRGRNLQCWCPPTSAWCHADALLRAANRSVAPR